MSFLTVMIPIILLGGMFIGGLLLGRYAKYHNCQCSCYCHKQHKLSEQQKEASS